MTTTDLSLRAVIDTNRERCARWHAEGEPWTGADWSNAMCGEAGEAANVVKKLRRHETGAVQSYNTPDAAVLRSRLGEEIADTILYALLLADHYGIDVPVHLVGKFNRVSMAQDFPERLQLVTS
jgi:NTP pyrophosphatase (non-canonical NTP hydrolase)